MDLKTIITAHIYANDNLVVSGVQLIKELLLNIDHDLLFDLQCLDGQIVKEKQLVFSIQGKASLILKEDTILNTLSLHSSLSTNIKKITNILGNYKTRLLVDSGNETFHKSIKDGTALVFNMNTDQVMLIKSEHYSLIGDLNHYCSMFRFKNGKIGKIALEVKTLEQFKLACLVQPEIIILKEMSIELLNICINLSKNKPILIASGINLSNVLDYAKLGVDYILIQDLLFLDKIVNYQIKYTI